MTLRKTGATRPGQWAERASRAVRRWVSARLAKRLGEPCRLRPRCCRNEPFREYQ